MKLGVNPIGDINKSFSAYLVRNTNYGTSILKWVDVPNIKEILDGMRFINAYTISSELDSAWTSIS